MYAVEFEAPIENGVVHIPEQYKELQQTKKARFVVMYDTIKEDVDVKAKLEEFKRLRAKSNNKIKVTMDLLSKIDKEMIDDDIF